MNQNDANFLAGIEVGYRCCEKGMNLQSSIAYGQMVVKEYPSSLDNDAPRTAPAPNVDVKCSVKDCKELAAFIIDRQAYCAGHRV